MGVDGTGLRQLTSTKGLADGPAWAPDGSRLSFQDSASSATHIVDISGGEVSTIPEWLDEKKSPGTWFRAYVWSPDGSRIAGHRTRSDGVTAGIAMYSIETGTFEQLTGTGLDPRWLADGRRLIYASEKSTLRLVDRESTRTREILSLLPDAIQYPVPSRNDRWIYFVRGSAEADLWLLTLE